MRVFSAAESHSLRTKLVCAVGLASVAVLGVGCSSSSSPSNSNPPNGAQPSSSASAGGSALDELVAQAQKEGSLVVTMQSSWPKDLAPKLVDAFKKRLGLNIDISLTGVSPTDKVPVAIAAAQAGAPATYDSMQADDTEGFQLVYTNTAVTIDNWQELLTEINSLVKSGDVSADKISPKLVAGKSFLVMANVKGMIYNTDKVSAADLPKKHEDLTDPKYKGKFTQPPWTSHWDIAPAAIDVDRDTWLDVVRNAGKNSGSVLSESEGVNRVLLGQYDFALAQDTYYNQNKAKDPNAPIGFQPFEDYNDYNAVYYSVLKGAKHPAGGTLWALWMTTPEAEAIWQPEVMQGSPLGDTDIDKAQQKIADGGAVLGYLDNDKTADLLKWFSTKEGADWLEKLANAIKGQ